MTDIMTSYGYNERAAEEGVKMYVGADEKTEYVVIRRANNKSYVRELTSILQANAKRLEALEKTDQQSYEALNARLMAEVLAKTVVVGFGPGVTFNKKPIPDTWEARQEILMAPTSLKLKCIEFANDDKNYPVELDVEDVKKS